MGTMNEIDPLNPQWVDSLQGLRQALLGWAPGWRLGERRGPPRSSRSPRCRDGYSRSIPSSTLFPKFPCRGP